MKIFNNNLKIISSLILSISLVIASIPAYTSGSSLLSPPGEAELGKSIFENMDEGPKKKILLVYPEYPETFWTFKHALKFVFKKALCPPLGLLTVASMLPEKWEKKLVDMNVTALDDKDIEWADFVFISAIAIQEESVKEIITRCKRMDVKIVAGGPLFRQSSEFEKVDHLLLDEAEITLPQFLQDLRNGHAKRIYTSDDYQWADIEKTPVPLWELVDMKKYFSMNIQYSRGCKFNCEFCDIYLLDGHKVRTKNKDQIVAELESLYVQGWRGQVFFVDDNFIGNTEKLKEEILPAIIEWMEMRGYPFQFITQASIDLSDDDELMDLMVHAGFHTVFIGIESPDEESLAECGKIQNKNRDLIADVKKIQDHGMEVDGAFIVGFDNDTAAIFDTHIEFIQESRIATAMVSPLNVIFGTRLHQRLIKEGRMLEQPFSNNTDFMTNFIPRMGYETLIEGYKRIVRTIYSPVYYYKRVKEFLKYYKPLQKTALPVTFVSLVALFLSMLILGIIEKERFYYWRLLFWTIFRRPRLLPQAVTLMISGYHFRKNFEKYLNDQPDPKTGESTSGSGNSTNGTNLNGFKRPPKFTLTSN